ncbi:dipeptide epimerase [Halorussus caseinilyticus]|uniref:Dipeptide epimerase n=1 Tax=Halorussus caseinilyticus TaxID=3034025 RepID=A0ABD5WE89_9EURY|nr:dipeptide epimerase [Halorussus sp. DT72]
MSEIVAASVRPLNLPLEGPIETALGTKREATNLLVTVETASGTTGYGEGSPIPMVTGETQAAAIETARAATEVLEGRDVRDYRALVGDVRSAFPGMVSALFAVETAILDAYCRERGIALAELFGGSPEPVETDQTIPIEEPATAAGKATAAVEAGFDHLKLKTGGDVGDDVERVAAVAEAVPDAALKVDANQGWTPKETVRFADRVADRGVELELIEQPVPADDVTGLAQTRELVGVPIAADEAVFTPADAVRVVREEAADVLNAKLGKSGPLAVGDIAAIARGADLDLMVGCMLESAVGIHTSAHVVAGTGAFSYVDLDGNRFLAEGIVEDSGPVHDIAGPGHGVTPDEQAAEQN